jgi:hypothetical protein
LSKNRMFLFGPERIHNKASCQLPAAGETRGV